MKKFINYLLIIAILCVSVNSIAYADNNYFNDKMWNATCNYNDGLYYEALGILNSLSLLDLTLKETNDLNVLKGKVDNALSNQADILSQIQKVQNYVNKQLFFEASDALFRLNKKYPSLPPSENNISWNLLVQIKNGFSGIAKKEYSKIRKYIKDGLYYEAIALCDKTMRSYYCDWTNMLNDDVKSTLESFRSESENKLNAYLNKGSNLNNDSRNTSYRIGKKTVSCKRCQGDGYITCKKCVGKGLVWDLYHYVNCIDCHGSGKVICGRCIGKGLETEEYYY